MQEVVVVYYENVNIDCALGLIFRTIDYIVKVCMDLLLISLLLCGSYGSKLVPNKMSRLFCDRIFMNGENSSLNVIICRNHSIN